MRLFKKIADPEPVKEKIMRILSQEKLRYNLLLENEQQTVFKLGMGLEIGNTDCFIAFLSSKELVEIYTVAPFRVTENKRAEVAKYLHGATKNLAFGYFEFDGESGEIRVKTYFLTKGISDHSDEVFKENLYTNFNIMEYYMPGVMQIIYGKIDSKSALNNILNNINPQWN